MILYFRKHGKDASPKRLLGVLSPITNNDNSMTSDSGPRLPSPAEMDYKPWFLDAPECLSSDKENLPPHESVTPPTLDNLSAVMTTPRASSPYPD